MDINSHSFAEGHYCGVQIVAKYLKDRSDLITSVFPQNQTAERDNCLILLYLRAAAWLQTMERLNHVVCNQAILAGVRSLFEITVDIILLHNDKTNDSGYKMECWSKSEKFKHAEQTIAYYQAQGLSVPDEHKPLEQVVLNERSNIENLRKNLWPPKSKHPNRWTGSLKITEDIKKADSYGRFSPEDLGVTLEELYNTDFRIMSWYVHSGITNFSNPTEYFNLVAGRAFYLSANLGMLCAKILLKDFGFTDHLSSLQEEWDRVLIARGENYLRKLDQDQNNQG